MSDELIASQCCPTFFKATRVDNSCFRIAEAYIAEDTFNGISDADRKFVRFGTDDEGDDLCWEVDRSRSFTGVPAGFTTMTGITPATDIVDSADKILLESATQDSAIYVIVAACRKSDWDVILKGGSGADYLVNDATKAANFRKRYGSSSIDGGGLNQTCLAPKQQFFAFDIRSTTTIDGSATHANNFDDTPAGNASPIAVGKFIKVTANLVDSSGSAASVYKDTVGNNSEESSTNASSVTNEIFKVIDIKRQTRPGASNSATYMKSISAFFADGSTITVLPDTCTDCLQAYLQTEGQAHENKTLGDIIPFDSGSYLGLFNSSPTLWPCRVNIERTYDPDMSGARVGGFERQKIRGREDFLSTTTPTYTRTNCNDPSENGTQLPVKSFDHGYDTDSFSNLPFTKNIFEAHRNDPNAEIATVKVSAEYTKNLRMARSNALDSKACGNSIHVQSLGSGDFATNFDYILNSVTVTTTYTTPSFTGDVPEAVIFPSLAQSNSVESTAIIPGWKDTQPENCGGTTSSCNFFEPGYILNPDVSARPVVEGEFLSGGTPTIGYNQKAKVYKGRIAMRTPTKGLIPMLRYAQFYCNPRPDGPDYQNNTIIDSIINEDLPRMNNTIDLVVPLAPQLEIAAGFNVNGFRVSEKLTSEDRGRTDVVDEPGGSGKCYPDKSHQSKITFGDANTTGTAITGLPFYMTTYAIGTGDSYLYQDGDHTLIVNTTIRNNIEANLTCDDDDEKTKRVRCDGLGICDAGVNEPITNCRQIHSLVSPHFMAHFIANNKYTKFDGTTTGIDFTNTNFLYQGNGQHYLDGALSGDAYEYVNTSGGPATSTGLGNQVGIDSEWSTVYIEAQDPFARGCTGCMRTVFNDDNYALITETIRSDTLLTENSNPHTI